MKHTLLTEWNADQFKTVKKAILSYFKSRKFETLHNVNLSNIRTFNDLDNILGMAYTSTSSFAMYSICNTEVYFDDNAIYNIICFGLSTDGLVYCLLYDLNESELLFPISKI